jgi:phosphatidylglycerol lysyltransferase
LAALIACRVIFYLIPLGLAAGAFAAWEIRGARASGRATARDASPASSPTDASVHQGDRNTEAQFLGQHALQHAEAVMHTHPRSKAYLALLGDKEFMFDPAQHAFLMFGRCGRSWICLGDPVGPAAVAPGLINSFIRHVRADGGRPVFHEVGADYLALYLGHDLAVLKIAEEARIRLSAFSLAGHSHQTLRNAVRSAERTGVLFELLEDDDLARSIEELGWVSSAWLAAHHGREKRFSMGRFDPAYIRHFRMATGRWNGALVAFVTVWSGHSSRELFVDLMRVRPEAPRGTMDYLIVQLIRWAQSSGFEILNLGMAPVMAAPGSWHRPSSWPVMVARQFGERFYHFRGLRQFKDKFTPDWRARYLVAPPGVSMGMAQIDLARLISGGWTGAVARG